MNSGNIMIVGVGGQGTLVASRLLGNLFVNAGMDVKMSEVHGMSQRGGSVVTYVRYGEKVYSPVISAGEADFIVAFEKIEAARYAECLKAEGTIIVNSREREPMSVTTGQAKYPHEILNEMADEGIDLDSFDALKLAREAGSDKAVNIVLMGRLSKYFNFPEEDWINALKNTVKPATYEINEKAFRLGRK
ncbi:MAG: indolepyruvate oxidoreductase subunit beta [Lachnospiraceae bacterium]|nr:indolepyruvate oxidoreductase subunit beta [Lachnospiraceae bacterium]